MKLAPVNVTVLSMLMLLGLSAAKCGTVTPQDPGQSTAPKTGDTASTRPTNGAATGAGTPTGSIHTSGSSSSSNAGNTGDTNKTSSAPAACQAPKNWIIQAGCPNRKGNVFSEFPSGCYLSCNDTPETCPTGTQCSEVESDPCAPRPGASPTEPQCDACAMGQKLCLPLSFGEACKDFPGIYKDVELKECGRSSTGVTKCHWTLTFREDGTFNWRFSDISQEGRYICHEGILFLDQSLPLGGSGPKQRNRVPFDSTNKTLTWEGVIYHREVTGP